MGGAGLLAGAAAGCRTRPDPYVAAKPPVPVERGLRGGSEKQVLTTCGLCPAGCGLRVRVVDGRAVKVEGNADSPVNRGALCARGQAGLELLYHSSRMRGPRRRLGARGENRWQAISWSEAIAQLAAELDRLRSAGEPESLVLLDGEHTGTTHALWARFLASFGSPNHIGHGATGFGAALQVTSKMTRRACLPSYDFERSRCVLLVGTGPLEASPHFMHLARAVAGASRPRLFCASSRLPATATLVDEWLSLEPGSAASLMLGILHVLLREQLGDESVLEWASGFAPWVDETGSPQPGLRAQVMAEFTVESVEARTGIPASKIVDLARELVAARPSVVVVDEGMSDHATLATSIVVNALLGSLDVPGGMQLNPGLALADFGAPAQDKIARIGLRAPAIDGRDGSQGAFATSRILALPEAFLSGKPYPAKVVLLSYSNPVYSKPDGRRWMEAMAKVPFVVSFSPILDESVLGADLVLPDHTFFERWDIVAPGLGPHVLSLRQPVVRPLTDSLQTGDVILRLARALGGSIAGAFPWDGYRQAVLAGLARLEGGADAVLEEIESKGVWCLPAGQGGPEGFEGDGAQPGKAGNRPLLFDVRGILPVTPASGDVVRFPFVLVPFRGPGYAEGGMRQLAWLRELPLCAGDPWPERIEIARKDAQALGVEDGDRVVVESSMARVELQAQVRDGIRPGVLGLPLGGGPEPAQDAAPGASRLLASVVDESTGHWFAHATRVQVRKVS